MTATTEPRELALPVLSGQIQIGPAEYIGGEVMHQAKHNGTGRYFRMGDREAFLLTHLDGRHTLDSIAEKYRSQFG